MADPQARILVVDGDPAVRDLLSRQLRQQQFDIYLAHDATAGLAAAVEHVPDLIIMDRMTPGLDGISLSEHLRADLRTNHIPIIMLVARDDHDEMVSGKNENPTVLAGNRSRSMSKLTELAIEADDFVAKPFAFAELLASVNVLLHRGLVQSSAHGSDSGTETDPGRSFIAGVRIATVLQMLQLEHRSCQVEVRSRLGTGTLMCRGGQLVDASFGTLTGEAAAYEILRWQDPQVAIRDAIIRVGETVIRTPLTHLLMESVRQEDERLGTGELYHPEASTASSHGEPFMLTTASSQNGAKTFGRSTCAYTNSPLQAIGGPQVMSDWPDSPSNGGQLSRGIDHAVVDAALDDAMRIPGAIGVALLDLYSGKMHGKRDGPDMNLNRAVAGHFQMVQVKRDTLAAMGMDDDVEDMLITLSTQYHLIRLVASDQSLGLCLVLARSAANLALARRQLAQIERGLAA